MNKPILAKAVDEVTFLALRRTAILTDTLQGLSYQRDSQQIVASDTLPTSVDILVIGKEHYNEDNRRFPLQSRRELNKILALESGSDSSQIMLYHIGDYIDGERKVVVWTCPRQLLAEKALKPLLILPESLLLMAAAGTDMVSLTRQQKMFWFYNRDGHFLSAQKKGLITSAAMFKASAGLADDVGQLKVVDENYLAVLFSHFSTVSLKNLLGLKTSLRQLQPMDLRDYGKYCGISAAVLISLYLGISSLYLQLRLDSAIERAAQFGGKTQAVFDVKQQLSSAQQKQAQLAKLAVDGGIPSVVWRLISPLITQGVSIESLGCLPDGTFLIRGKAKKDTQVLEFLNNDEFVVDPGLRTGTTTVNGVDSFNISFKIKGSMDE